VSKGGYFDPTATMESFTAPPTPRPDFVMPAASEGAQTRGDALNAVEQSTVFIPPACFSMSHCRIFINLHCCTLARHVPRTDMNAINDCAAGKGKFKKLSKVCSFVKNKLVMFGSALGITDVKMDATSIQVRHFFPVPNYFSSFSSHFLHPRVPPPPPNVQANIDLRNIFPAFAQPFILKLSSSQSGGTGLAIISPNPKGLRIGFGDLVFGAVNLGPFEWLKFFSTMLGFNNFELFIKEIGFNIKPYAFKFQGTLVAFKVSFPFSLFVSFTNGNKIPVVAVTFAYEASLSTVFRQLFPALAWMPPLMEVCFSRIHVLVF
jgi:hypothetical protein